MIPALRAVIQEFASTRPGWTDYGLIMALAASTRGECVRRKVGAVILDAQHHLAGAGYNGSYPGGPSCLGGECPRARHREEIGPVHGVLAPRCAECHAAWPCRWAVQPGSSYDTGPGECHAVHAEMNALLDVSDRNRLLASTMYITTSPCDGCLKILRSTAIRTIIYLDQDDEEQVLVWPFER